jgi:4-aminobutyrate aminotransferase-like enzyme/Ser/Thr protein kinase RdoA (MazF antagonist)
VSFGALLGSANPRLSPEHARALVARHWGIAGELSEIGSTQDQNFRVDAGDGRRFVLKIANASWARADLELQNAAMRHLAAAGAGFEVPLPLAAVDGAEIVADGGHDLRLVTWVDGTPLADGGPLGAATLAGLGTLAARCQQLLADFDHPRLERTLQWEPRQARALVDELLPGVADAGRRALVAAAMAPLDALLAGGGAALPVQAVHCDVTDYNVVGRRAGGGPLAPSGLIDFGDVVRTWRVTEPAHAAMAAVFHNLDDPLGGALTILAAHHAQAPLSAAESAAFWPVLLARAAVCALSSAHQAALAGGGEHLERLVVEDWAVLEAVVAVPRTLAVAAARAACGFDPDPDHSAARAAAALGAAAPAPLLDTPGPLIPIDLSVGSEALAFGAWESRAGLQDAVAVDGVAAGRWGEIRLAHAGAPGPAAPRVLHTGADLFAAEGTAVRAPLDAVVHRVGERDLVLALAIDGAELLLRLAGLTPAALVAGAAVGRGEPLGAIAPAAGVLPAHLHVQLCLGEELPGLVAARDRAAALALCPDPSALLGVDVAAPPPPAGAAEADRRARTVGAAQSLYYREPPVMVRGWRHHLYDAEGRPYVDGVNNVALVGHSHPRIAAAAARELRLLNTNSRFLYPQMADYSERLTALLPDALSSVLLVSTGSEAVELALRIARAVTGRDDVLAVEGAYHGWTAGPFDICTYPPDRPTWRGLLPPTTHVVEQPDPYRGRFGADAAPYVASVAAACRDAAARGGPAAFISEPLLGNQGGIAPPPGYLAGAYAAVRAAGGLCIADEIQVGFGRTGEHLWAFEHEGVVPDIVCVAKAAGNGYPLGAVICRPEIAEAFAAAAAFFSSPAGSPLSCAVGSAVIDVLLDEGLQRNALEVGAVLRDGFEQLAADHAVIGAVHGRGLYLGVDLVRDRETKEPAARAARELCERVLGLGVVLQPTGDRENVLKVKPPLCLDADGARTLVASVARVLEEGLATGD